MRIENNISLLIHECELTSQNISFSILKILIIFMIQLTDIESTTKIFCYANQY